MTAKRKWLTLTVAAFILLTAAIPATAAASDTQTFTDVPTSHWANAYIESVYAKKLMTGTGSGKFDPEQLVTKAEMAQTLYNVYEGRIPDNVVVVPQHFNDVANDAWYRDAVYWAARTGLANYGYRQGDSTAGETGAIYTFGSSNTFSGRMTAAIYLGRLADAMKVELPKIADSVTFPDAEGYYLKDADGNNILSQWREVQPYITAYIYALQRADIIGGFPDGTFRPDEGLTRAQWAKLIDLFTNLEGLQP